MPRKTAARAATVAIAHVHDTTEHVTLDSMTPPHPPRESTPLYEATHKRLTITEDRPCFICGVRRSDLQDEARRADPMVNPFGAKDIESHHWPVERSLADAVDPEAVARDYPTVHQFKTFMEWIDSGYNMLVLCDQCHRLAPHAIHGALYQVVIATKYAIKTPEGQRYLFASRSADVAATIAHDEAVVGELGIEAAVAAEVAAEPAPVKAARPRRSRAKVPAAPPAANVAA